jgi:hypothetical protein
MKLPSYIVQNLFYRLGLDAEPVKSSSIFVHKAKCPLCADHAQRLYLREYSSFYSVKCHNCGYNGNFESFLKENYSNEYEELRPFILESIKDGSIFAKRKCLGVNQLTPSNVATSDLIDVRLKMYLKEHAFQINKKQDSVKKEELRKRILKYLKGRKIPESIYNDFYCMLKGPLRGYIGIPFFDKNKENLVHIQGRLFIKIGEGDHPKYMFLKDKIDGIELDSKEIWGLWRTNPAKPVIICEGTLDACAFEHGVATCGATMGDNYIEIIKKQFPNRIWCIDSFWTDIEGRKLTIKLLEMGERCFILPQSSFVKDANELLCKVLGTEYITDEIIEEYTYTGRFGLIKLRTMEVTSLSQNI